MTKKIYKVTEAQYKTLQEGGTITVGGVSYTYETGSDVAYIVVDPTTPEYRLKQVDDAIQLTKDGTVVSDLGVGYSDRAGYSTFAHTLVYPNTSSATYTFDLYDGGTVNGLTTFNNGINVNSKKITNLATPTANTDAANKSYIDGKITTYTLTADTTNNKIKLTPSSGTAQSVTVPFATTATNLTNTPSLLTSGNTIAVKAGEKTSSYITVPFATNCSAASSAGYAAGAGGATNDGNGNNIVNTYATKTELNSKYTKPSTGIPASDLAESYALKTAAVNSLSVSGTTLSYKDVNGTQLGSVTLPSSTDTKNTAGSSNSTSKLFLVGTTSQSSTGIQSYSNKNVYETNGSLYATTFYENNTALSSKYLRLAGGTVTGDVTFNNNSYFNNIYATTSTWGDASASSLDVSTGTITANKFIKTNGTSSEFLKADGSTDTNEYQVKLVSGTNIKTVNGNSLLGYGNIEISGGSSYTLPTATSSVLGGVKLGSDTVQTVSSNAVTTTSSRTYAIQKNSSGQMVVNVPWTDTDTHKYPFVANYGTGNLEVNLVFTEWTPLFDYSSYAAADAVHAKGFMTIYWPPTSGGPTVTNKQFLSWLSDEYFSDTEIEHANGTVRLVYSDVDSQSDSYIIWGTDVSNGSWKTFTPYTLDVTCSSTSTNYIRKSCVNSFSSSGTGSIKTLYTSSLYGINITNDSFDEAHITFEFDLVITNHSGY